MTSCTVTLNASPRATGKLHAPSWPSSRPATGRERVVDQGPNFATLEAEQLVRDRGTSSLPVDPFEIAREADIDVVEKPATGGVSGMLIRSGNSFAIAYATYLPNEGFQRFSVAHELGHYFLRGHHEHVFDASGVHVSRAGYLSQDPYEKEADQFAAGLLMPRSLFVQALRVAGEGLDAIQRLATTCKTSLTATAIRFAEHTDEPVAVVVSSQTSIEYCFMSNTFRNLRGLTWLKRGTPIPRRTTTYRFVGDPGRIADADRDEGTVKVQEWFDGGPDVDLVRTSHWPWELRQNANGVDTRRDHGRRGGRGRGAGQDLGLRPSLARAVGSRRCSGCTAPCGAIEA